MKVPAAPTVPLSNQPLGYLRAADYSQFVGGLEKGFQALAGIGEELQARQDHTERLKTLVDFSNAEQSTNDALIELKRNTLPGDKTYLDRVNETINKQKADFMKGVPPQLQDEFNYRFEQVRQGGHNDARQFEYVQQDAFARTGIADITTKAKVGVGADPTSLETWSGRVNEAIDSSTLSGLEKEKAKREALTELQKIGYGDAAKKEIAAGSVNKAVDLLKGFEGFSGSAYYDVNAHRVGYGSDTTTDVQGGVHQVDKSTMVTRADAERDLARRAQETQQGIIGKIGADAWNKLNDNQQAALTSLAYNYGSLPDRVVGAVQSGDPAAMSQAVARLGMDNNGVNRERRAKEAALLYGRQTLMGAESGIDNDPRYALVPYEDRLSLRQDATTALARDQAAQLKAGNENYNRGVEDLLNSIHDGKSGQTEIDTAAANGLKFTDRERAENLLKKIQGDVSLESQGLAKLSSEFPSFDQTDPQDKKMLNAVFGKTGTEAIQKRDQSYVTGTLVPMINKAGDAPTDAMGMLSSQARSRDPMAQKFALDALSQIRDQTPSAFNIRTNPETKSAVQFYKSNTALSQEEMLKQLRGGDTAQEHQANEVLRDEARKIVTASPNAQGYFNTTFSRIAQDFPGAVPPADPSTQVQIEAEYQSLFVTEYPKYRDAQKAWDAVTAIERTQFGVSPTGLPVLMKHPLDMSGYQPLGGDYGWVDRTFRKHLDIRPNETFQLISDDRTAAELEKYRADPNAPLPSYNIVAVGPDGVSHTITDKRVRPSPDPEDKAMDAQTGLADIAAAHLGNFMSKVYVPAAQLYQDAGTPIPQDILDQKLMLETKAKEAQDLAAQARTTAMSPVEPQIDLPDQNAPFQGP